MTSVLDEIAKNRLETETIFAIIVNYIDSSPKGTAQNTGGKT